jgi:hypothetical protein
MSRFRIPRSIKVSIPTDENGMTGRECPKEDCLGYFKIRFGTGLTGPGLPCHCPYCGHKGPQDTYWTREQLEYAKSIAVREFSKAIVKEMKKHEFNIKPRGPFGIGMSMKVKPGRPRRIHYYREKALETEIVCTGCTLQYSIYGVFGYCPDCGVHNSRQILEKNLEIIDKMLTLASSSDKDISEKLIENALEDCVSAFDGFGRELCRINAGKSKNPAQAEKVSFQNLEGAKTNLASVFGVDLSSCLSASEWASALSSSFALLGGHCRDVFQGLGDFSTSWAGERE